MSCGNGGCGGCEESCEEKAEAQQKQMALWKNIFHKALGANTLTEAEADLVLKTLEAFPE